MKQPISSLCRGLLLTALAFITFTAVSAADFEGRVHMEVTSGKKKEKMGMDYSMKDGKVRMDMQAPERERHGRNGGGGMGMIFDVQAREMIILMDMDGRKMFMRRAIPQPQPNAEGTGKARDVRDAHKMSVPEATGRTEMIAGYKAKEYRTTTEKGEVIELWLAKGLGPFMSYSGGNPMMGGRGTPPAGWENFAREGNTFPMRVVTHDTGGAETMRMEVTSVEKTSLPDSLFSTEGYSEFSIPGMGGTGGFNPFKRD